MTLKPLRGTRMIESQVAAGAHESQSSIPERTACRTIEPRTCGALSSIELSATESESNELNTAKKMWKRSK